MRTLKRVAAILCSATVLTGLSTVAFIANAQETVSLKERESDFDSEVVNVVADQVYAVPGEKVTYCVYLVNNGGFSGSGIVLDYDERLMPEIQEGTEDIPVIERGVATANLLPTYSLNKELHILAASTVGSVDAVSYSDGVYLTTWFTVPEDAKNGDTYPIELTVSRWMTNKSEPISYYQISGWIKVKIEDTTTTTESTTTTTNTTTTTESTTTTTQSTTTTTDTTSTTTDSTTGSTSSTTESSTTTTSETTDSTSSKVTDSTSSDTTTSTTVTYTETQAPVTESSTLTTEKTTKHVTKPTEPNADDIASTTKAPGASTGDSGVAVAVTALALAAAAAVVSGVKRKEQ